MNCYTEMYDCRQEGIEGMVDFEVGVYSPRNLVVSLFVNYLRFYKSNLVFS